MGNLNKEDAHMHIENVRAARKDFAVSITALYVGNAYKCLKVLNFKELCLKHFPGVPYKVLCEHAKAGEISESLNLDVGRYSNSAILELRLLNVSQRKIVWSEVCRNLDDSSPNTRAVTRDLVRKIILENKIPHKNAKKSKRPKFDAKEIVEAIEIQDANRIAGIFYSMISDIPDVNLVLDKLNELYDNEFDVEDDEGLSMDEDLS